jgi:hypothetical protein
MNNCPHCNGTNLHIEKKGFNTQRAVVGTILLGPLGAFAGNKDKNTLEATCLDCGNVFNPVNVVSKVSKVDAADPLGTFLLIGAVVVAGIIIAVSL